MKPYTLKKLKIYSYILDIDPIIDPKDTYNSFWSIPFLIFLRKLREEYNGNLLALSVGESHTITASDNSRVYYWGGSSQYQLGFFESFAQTHPKEFSLGLKPTQANYLLAGNNHNLMYTRSSNKLYSWGDNSLGQLGIGHYSNVKGIIDLSSLTKGKEIAQVESRGDISGVIVEDGTAFVWPFETSQRPTPEPYHIRIPGDKLLTVAVGFDFVMMTSETGKLYSMGKSNSCGELGHGDFVPRSEPTLVTYLSQSGDKYLRLTKRSADLVWPQACHHAESERQGVHLGLGREGPARTRARPQHCDAEEGFLQAKWRLFLPRLEHTGRLPVQLCALRRKEALLLGHQREDVQADRTRRVQRLRQRRNLLQESRLPASQNLLHLE